MRLVLALSMTLALWVPLAHAQEPTGPAAQLTQLDAMMSDARFEEALAQARALLDRTDLSATQRNGTLETLAIAQLATRDQRGARETLALLYARDPDHRMLNRDASPAVVAAFDRAREAHPTPVPVTIESASPTALTQRAAPVLQVRLTAGADTVNELRLSYRQGDARDFQRVLMEHAESLATAQARLPVLDGEEEYSLDWYVEALAPSQSVVGRLGDALQPLSLLVPRAAVRADANLLRETNAASRSEEHDRTGGSVLGTWWFWTVVGVVALGGATAAYLLTLPADLTPCGSLGCGTLQ